MRKVAVLLLLFATLSGQDYTRDIIVLKSGKTIIGTIIKTTGNKIHFESNGETKIYHKLEIKILKKKDGTILIGDANIESKLNQYENNVSKSSIDFYKFLKVDNQLRPEWNFHSPKDPFKAGILSLVIPSGGHYYNEQYQKGGLYLFGVPILYFAGGLIVSNNLDKDSEEGVAAGLSLQIIALFFHIYNVYDAVMSANEINKEYYKESIQVETIKQE